VILVGGSTRTPLVQRIVEEKLGQQSLTTVDPDLCVSMGAAIQGGLIAGLDVGPVLVDITPHTLGIRCVAWEDGVPTDRHFSRMIARNTALPAKRSHIFHKCHEGQDVAEIDIHQGENDDATLNDLVGSFKLEGMDESPDASSEILVRFELDVNGTLTATAVERATSLEKTIRIDNAITRFRAESQADAKKKLAKVLGLAASEPSDREGSSTSLSASLKPHIQLAESREQKLIDQAESLLEGASEPDRVEIGQLVEALRNALTAQNNDEIASISDKLEDVLFYVKDA
jgi:molecular chaperone DnaK